MKNRTLFLLSIATLVLAACSGTASNKPVEITLDAAGMGYQPNRIEVIAGQTVRLTFRNNDITDHDFSIIEIPMASAVATEEPLAGHDMGHVAEEPELHTAALMGTTSTIEFTPTKPGTYEFFCTVAGHKEAGMVGTLIVKAP